MAKISGILKDGAGQIINDCTIELYAKKTTNNVLTQTQAFTVANDGRYSINAQPCEYDVSLIINGFPKKRLGAIAVYSDSVDGSLNDYLINPPENDLTPEFLKQVFDARSEAKNSAIASSQSATNSENSATAAKTSEINAKSFADEAKTSADNADNNAQIAVKSSATATEAASTAVTSSDTAKSYADNARDSATASSQSATNSANSAIAAKTSETNANNSANNAKTSEDNAKKWASTVDNSNFIKKTGDETQRIDGQLDVKKLTEQGQRVYSPNNKPSADDVGAVPAVKEDVNGSPIYMVGVNVDVASLSVGGKSVITDVSNIQNQINQLNNRIYIVESYVNGNSWYNVYSNGFIEQSSIISINTNGVQLTISTVINLLKPMHTQNYGVSIDLYSGGGPWGWVRFACGEMYNHNFRLISYTEANPGMTLIRWTVRGY